MSVPGNLIICYYDNGRVHSISEVDENNKRNGLAVLWYIDGKKKKEVYYKNDLLHGISKAWRRSGSIMEEANWVNDKKHGKYSLWYEYGQIWEETYYDHGKLHGSCVTWHSYGEVERIRYYANHQDVTIQIIEMVDDIQNMTDAEKTIIALQFGFVL